MRFTLSNSWHTLAYLFSTAIVTYIGKLPLHCMQASLWSHACVDLLYDTMPNNADSIQCSMHNYVYCTHGRMNRKTMLWCREHLHIILAVDK